MAELGSEAFLDFGIGGEENDCPREALTRRLVTCELKGKTVVDDVSFGERQGLYKLVEESFVGVGLGSGVRDDLLGHGHNLPLMVPPKPMRSDRDPHAERKGRGPVNLCGFLTVAKESWIRSVVLVTTGPRGPRYGMCIGYNYSFMVMIIDGSWYFWHGRFIIPF